MNHIDILFDGPPGPTCGRFVEVEDSAGKGLMFGHWVERKDGYWALRINSYEFPVWDEAHRKQEAGEELTPIEEFLLEETPAKPEHCADWRKRFEAVLRYFCPVVTAR